MVTRGKYGIRKPKAYALVSPILFEPKSCKIAIKIPEWKDSMRTEYDALLSNDIWQLVPLPHGEKVIGCKWVFRVKLLSPGCLYKYKSILVALGYL